MKSRIGALIVAVTAGLLLMLTMVVSAQSVTVADSAETEREQLAAQEAEAQSAQRLAKWRSVLADTDLTMPALFVGVDDFDVSTYAIDVLTGEATALFDGIEIWGAAYDWRNEIVYMVDGTTLIAWPLGDAPVALGTIRGDGEPDTALTFVGLAFFDGTLYGSRNIGNPTYPEGLYTIDPSTQRATLVATFSIGASAADIGGLDADPILGGLYGTNDDSDARGLVTIELDGTVTVVAPYPADEDDVDGLAVGNDGRAYLVTDEPGDFYVYDLAAGAYVDPIGNPWTTSRLFAGAAWVAPLTPSVTLTKTVGLDPDVCAQDAVLDVMPGTEVTYCYEVTNSGEIALGEHDLADDQLGAILEGFPYTLQPGASAFITQTVALTQTTVNVATWTAYNSGPTDVVSATATAEVTVPTPSITLTKTVGLDPNQCAQTGDLTVAPGTEVTYCFEVTNTGVLTLTTHSLTDSVLGQLLTDFEYALAPAASVFITETATIEATTVNTATWTANAGFEGVDATATATATVTVAPQIALEPDSISGSLLPGDTLTTSLTISSTGTVPLTWTITEAAPNCTAPSAVSWLDVTPPAGTTAPGEATKVSVLLNATGLSAGSYTAALCVMSNDPVQPLLEIPVELTVGEEPIYILYIPVTAGSPERLRITD
jgi:hypothetical protein